MEAKNRDLDSRLREEQALKEKAELRNKDLRKKLREAMDEIIAGKQQPGKVSQEEKEGSLRNNNGVVSEKLGNGIGTSNETKPPTSGKTSQKAKSFTSSVAMNGVSPIRYTISSDTAAAAPLGHSISQNPKPISNPMTPKSKGSKANSNLYPPVIDLGQKEKSEQFNGSDSTTCGRSQSFAQDTEIKSGPSTMENAVPSNAIKDNPSTLNRTKGSLSTIAAPPLIHSIVL